MSSGQSAVGTRTCSGDPAADWRLANGEGTVTSGCCREPNLPVNYASGRSAAIWKPPAAACEASRQDANPEKITSGKSWVGRAGRCFGRCLGTQSQGLCTVSPAGV